MSCGLSLMGALLLGGIVFMLRSLRRESKKNAPPVPEPSAEREAKKRELSYEEVKGIITKNTDFDEIRRVINLCRECPPAQHGNEGETK